MLKGFVFFLKTSWEFDKKYIFYQILSKILYAMATIVSVFIPKYLIDELIKTRPSISNVILYVAILLCTLFVSGYICNVLDNHVFLHRMNVFYHFNTVMSKKIIKAKYMTIEQNSFIDLRKKAEKFLYGDYRGFGIVFEKTMDGLGQMLVFLGISTIVFTLHPIFLVLFLTLSFINMKITAVIKKKNMEISLQQVPIERRASYLMDIIANFEYGKEIRINHLGDWLIGLLTKQIDYMQSFYRKLVKNDDSISLISALVGLVQQVSVYFYLIFNILKKIISIGDFTLYISAMTSFSQTLTLLTESYIEIKQYGDYYVYLKEFLNVQGEDDKSDSIEFQEKIEQIVFNGVSFRYPNQESDAINNISFQINAGEKIAIVGENGAGKTTLVKLLTRLYNPTEGKIFINGKDIASIEYKSLMNLFAVVYQDFKLFSLSLKENIALSNSESVMDKDILNITKKFGLNDKIHSLKLGLHTTIYNLFDDDGFQPSGGEAQKIALCRAYFKDAPIIILDEPTAALDARSEDLLYKNFNEITQNKTTIYITHRMASTRFCDKIIVLKSGQIVQIGTHNELIEDKNGEYYNLYRLQMKYYTSDES